MKKLLFVLMSMALIAFPNTVAYFSGQHTYTLKSCNDCHYEEGKEITEGTAMDTFECSDCHRPTSSTLAAHAATNINNSCIGCHPQVENRLMENNESHKNIYQSAVLDDSKMYANEACFFCHGDAPNSMNFSRAEFIEYEISVTDDGWMIQNFSTGKDMNYFVVLNRNNGLHAILKGADVQCTDCHVDIVTAINENGHYPTHKKFHTSTSSCSLCHNNWAQGTRYQHVSKSTNCITACHHKNVAKKHKGIFDSINNYPVRYQGNICLGCHETTKKYKPPKNKISKFKVFLEPRSDVLIEEI